MNATITMYNKSVPKARCYTRRHSDCDVNLLKNKSVPKARCYTRRYSDCNVDLLNDCLQNMIDVSSINPRKLHRILNASNVATQRPERMDKKFYSNSYHTSCNICDYCQSNEDEECICHLNSDNSFSSNDPSRCRQTRQENVHSIFKDDSRFHEVDGFFVYGDSSEPSRKKGLLNIGLRACRNHLFGESNLKWMMVYWRNKRILS